MPTQDKLPILIICTIIPPEQGTGQIPESPGLHGRKREVGKTLKLATSAVMVPTFCAKSTPPPIISARVSKVKYHNKWQTFRSCYGVGNISTTSLIKSLCVCVMCPDGKAKGVDNTQAQVVTGCAHLCTVLVRLAAVHELHWLFAVCAGWHGDGTEIALLRECLHWHFTGHPTYSSKESGGV